MSVFEMDEDLSCAFLLIPRDSSGKIQEVAADSFFNILHFGPTYECEGGEMVVHASGFDKYAFGKEMGFDVGAQDFDPIE